MLLALLRLSPHNRFRTAFLTAASVRDGTVGRELYLKGDGDLELVLEERSGCSWVARARKGCNALAVTCRGFSGASLAGAGCCGGAVQT